MQNNIHELLFAAILTISGADAYADGTVYKCKNQQGNLIYQGSPCAQNAQAVSSWAALTEAKQQDDEPATNFNGALIIKQHGNGHYFLDGSVNGKALTFLVDTGASAVSLPRAVATSAQIYCKNNILMQTANGLASACTAVIPRLKFGPFMVKNALATISPNLSQPLLGMSVLRQFRLEQDNGEMRISARN